MWFGGKNFQPFVRTLKLGMVTRYRQLRTPLVRSTVIIENPKQQLVIRYTGMSNGLDIIRVILMADLTH